MFKVGDKVRRKSQYIRTATYPYGNQILTVVKILPNSIILNKPMDAGWMPEYFDLIESNWVEVSTTVTRDEITLPDGRVLKYTIEPKPWVPKVGDIVRNKNWTQGWAVEIIFISDKSYLLKYTAVLGTVRKVGEEILYSKGSINLEEITPSAVS